MDQKSPGLGFSLKKKTNAGFRQQLKKPGRIEGFDGMMIELFFYFINHNPRSLILFWDFTSL